MFRSRVIPAACLAAVTVALSGCGGGGGETTTSAAATTTTTATATQAEPKTITITVVDGKPEGGIARPSVDEGDHVVLVVKSDTADEVHVHGYDLMQDVAAGGRARIAFTATIPGRFDIELEDTGVQLAELTVD